MGGYCAKSVGHFGYAVHLCYCENDWFCTGRFEIAHATSLPDNLSWCLQSVFLWECRCWKKYEIALWLSRLAVLDDNKTCLLFLVMHASPSQLLHPCNIPCCLPTLDNMVGVRVFGPHIIYIQKKTVSRTGDLHGCGSNHHCGSCLHGVRSLLCTRSCCSLLLTFFYWKFPYLCVMWYMVQGDSEDSVNLLLGFHKIGRWSHMVLGWRHEHWMEQQTSQEADELCGDPIAGICEFGLSCLLALETHWREKPLAHGCVGVPIWLLLSGLQSTLCILGVLGTCKKGASGRDICFIWCIICGVQRLPFSLRPRVCIWTPEWVQSLPEHGIEQDGVSIFVGFFLCLRIPRDKPESGKEWIPETGFFADEPGGDNWFFFVYDVWVVSIVQGLHRRVGEKVWRPWGARWWFVFSSCCSFTDYFPLFMVIHEDAEEESEKHVEEQEQIPGDQE